KSFFFQAEDGIRDRNVTGVQTVLFRSPRLKKITIIVNFSRISSTNYKQARVRAATAQELCFLTRGNGPPLRNRGFPRAGTIHRPGIAYSHARERSIAQELRTPTRGNGPPLRNSGIPRAGVLHHSGITDFHARKGSIAQELQNPTRGNGPPLRNRRISRVVAVQHSGIANFHAW